MHWQQMPSHPVRTGDVMYVLGMDGWGYGTGTIRHESRRTSPTLASSWRAGDAYGAIIDAVAGEADATVKRRSGRSRTSAS